ncbi:hypothetical protein [Sphingomonas sp. HMP9]|uniref:hypothetical protein n=1 Tax=Sphingomonas sp. HMP9 TaxID=1517554 RepID=UPI001597009F|nr:hypothetical protein [Sphingomonas sp. HMP9]
MADDHDEGLSKFVGVGGAAIVAGFFLNPILARFPPIALMWTALAAAASVIWFWRLWSGGKLLGWLSIVVGTGVGALAVILFYQAALKVEVDQNANDRRCLAIQHDMLSSTPLRADGPDLFQALGCRPQGEGSVYALPVKR